MFPIMCDICGNSLFFDYHTTIEEYLPKVNYMQNTIKDICDIALDSHLSYNCTHCAEKFKYTFKEVELKLIDTIKKDVKRYRKIYVFKNIINPMNIDPDNGLVFCGICDGVDNLGNCYNDIKNVCPLVKNEL